MDDSTVSPTAQAPPRWILLVHQLPPRPAYLRVRTRRRLQQLGAVLLKNTVYALPWSAEAVEDFQWLRQEIATEGGTAVLFDATVIAGLPCPDPAPGTKRARRGHLPDLSGGRLWVTRRDVHVDRIASSWLIRRWIDPRARIRCVATGRTRPESGALRFDMFEGEFTHEGERCTFETLLHRFGLGRDTTLRALGEIVHDLDCKDARFQRAETPRVGRLLAGVIQRHRTDASRLQAGARLLDRLYREWPPAEAAARARRGPLRRPAKAR